MQHLNKDILTPVTVVSFVVATTGILTSYYHFSYICVTKLFCNDTQLHAMCIRSDSEKWFRNQTNPNSAFVKAIAHWGPHVNAVLVVFFPILLVLISNAMLIYTLRQRQKQFFLSNSSIKSESQLNGGQSRTEHKVTITVCAIVTCFTITQGPSAIITILAQYHPIHDDWMVAVTAIITTMVVAGKALNFVLFCLSSANFRTRLLVQTKKGLLRKAATKRYNYEAVPQ